MQWEKIDGAIIAPEAIIDTNQEIQHYHGFVVAKQFSESAWYSNPWGNTGLQVHGQILFGNNMH